MQTAYEESTLKRVLQQTFGFETFRPGQLSAIQTLLSDGRLLCIQPTGHGKSLLYQLPTVLLDGVTLVISPLLALMRDQMHHLIRRFGIPAASINTDQTDAENDAARQATLQGKARILFVAPEQLDHVDRFQFLLNLPVSLVVVDEAHCISMWGHDFRPSYRQIIRFIQAQQNKNSGIKVLALTATANKRTEEDIKQQLAFQGIGVTVHRENMDRPNLHLSVQSVKGTAEKLAVTEALLRQTEGSGLIYCATRENTELVAEYLQKQGFPAAAYHAGYDPEDKRSLQEAFIADRYKAIAATNALGMGIDKPNIRFVIHFDVPGSITAYYQEVGRAGRDGLPAKGVLLYDPADRKVQEYFIESAQPKQEDFQKIMQHIDESLVPPNLTAIKRATGLHPTRVAVVLAELAEQGFVQKKSHMGVQVYALTGKEEMPDLARYQAQREVKGGELEKMLCYGEHNAGCLMAALRSALGDMQPNPCQRCSVCCNLPYSASFASGKVAAASSWLAERAVPIREDKLNRVSEGLSLLNGPLRSRGFADFMKQRSNAGASNFGLPEEVLELMLQRLSALVQEKKIKVILPIPSRTWNARDALTLHLAKSLGMTPHLHALQWRTLPESRQGELLNNDQRKFNVQNLMTFDASQGRPQGSILLLDDYIGSGSTLREAARAIRKEGRLSNDIVPFTVAYVKWHLGKRGMV